MIYRRCCRVVLLNGRPPRHGKTLFRELTHKMGLDNPLHIAFLLILLLLVFGAKRLPEMGKSLGSGMRGFRDSLSGDHMQPSLTAQQPADAGTAVGGAAAAPVAAPVAVPVVVAPAPLPAAAPVAVASAPVATHAGGPGGPPAA
jgi:sec-independent protein translocase protein TatA